MNIQGMKRIPVDPRVVERIGRSPHMLAEQGSGFMGDWGGPSTYRALTKLPENQRLVYAAVLDGATTEGELEIITGLSPVEVSSGLDRLKDLGLVNIETEEIT